MSGREQTRGAPAGRLGDQLFHQQCWLWGCDVRRPEGNLLLAYGFARERPPAGARGSSAYLHQPSPGELVALWGFGMFYGSPQEGGILLGRHRLAPRPVATLSTAPPPWRPEQIAAAPAPTAPRRCAALLAEALRWVARYEAWVAATCGAAYRQECLASWREWRRRGAPQIAAAQIAGAWAELAERSAPPGEPRAAPGLIGPVR